MPAIELKNSDIETGELHAAIQKIAPAVNNFRVRKLLAAVAASVMQGMRDLQREKEKLLFVYGKIAPALWPNAGQRVIDATLLSADEYSACVADFDALRAGVKPVEWERRTLTLDKKAADSLTVQEIAALELLFDLTCDE